RDAAGDLDVRGVPTAAADRDLVLARRGRRHELVRAEAAHHARVGLHDPVAEPAAVEDPPVGALVRRVGAVERGRVGVEGVGVLHQKLARAQHTRPWARLVTLLGLDLVPDLRQVTVGADLARGEPRDDFLVRHPEAQVASVAVLEFEHLRDALPAARLLPDVGGMDHGHRDLLPADRVHLLADDRVDLVEDALPERQVHVDAGGELTHEAGAEHELVAQRFGVVGIHDHHRAVPALREAAGLVDPDVVLETGPRHLTAEVRHEPLDIALRRAGIAPGAHEDVDPVLAHQSLTGAAACAAFRSAMNRSTSSRIAFTMSFSGTLRTTSPFLKMRPIPRPPATPMSAARASPGPFTSQLCSMAPGSANEWTPSTSRLCTCPVH